MNSHINKRKRDIMKGKKLLVTLAASAVLFAGCGMKSKEVVIRVNDTNITKAEFDKKMETAYKGSMFEKMGINIKDGHNGFVINILKQRVVNELIIKALIDEEVAKRGIKVSNADVEAGIKQIIEKVGSKEQLDKILKQSDVSPAQFRRDVAEQVRVEKMAEQLGDSSVTEAEAKQFYDKNPDKFTHPDQVRASHILIHANPAELRKAIMEENKKEVLSEQEISAKIEEKMAEKKAKIDAIRKELQGDLTKFAKVAKDKSEDPGSASKGGDLGFFPKGRMVPEFENAAFSLKPNTLSEVVKTNYGYHIIMVTDRKAASKDPFEKSKDTIMAYLKKEKQIKNVDNLLESLKKNATIEYVDPSYNPDKIQEEVKKQLSVDIKPEDLKPQETKSKK